MRWAKPFGFVVVLLVAVLAMAGPKSDLSLYLLLNGKPTKLGVLTSTGASVTNASTAVPFTLTGGSVIKVECDAAANVGLQATCHGTVTNANYCELLEVRPAQRVYVVPDSVTTISAISVSGTANCMVWAMR
jgi:hypothetical protein